jgi:uncharacterized membrane protein YeaQ/YmgE (transglycosylase-associated protein family)
MLNILLWLVMGGIVGWLASLVMKTNGQQGIILNVVFGLLGAAAGGFLFRTFGASGTNINEGFSLYSVLVSVVGAVVLIGIVQVVSKMTRSRA